MGATTAFEQLHQTFDNLIGTFLIVCLRALYRLQQSFAFLSNAHQRIVYTMILPRIFHQQYVQQHVGVMTHVMPICKPALPQQFDEERS